MSSRSQPVADLFDQLLVQLPCVQAQGSQNRRGRAVGEHRRPQMPRARDQADSKCHFLIIGQSKWRLKLARLTVRDHPEVCLSGGLSSAQTDSLTALSIGPPGFMTRPGSSALLEVPCALGRLSIASSCRPNDGNGLDSWAWRAGKSPQRHWYRSSSSWRRAPEPPPTSQRRRPRCHPRQSRPRQSRPRRYRLRPSRPRRCHRQPQCHQYLQRRYTYPRMLNVCLSAKASGAALGTQCSFSRT